MATRKKSPGQIAQPVDNVENAPQNSTDVKKKTATTYEPLSDELDARQLLQVLSEVKNGNFSVRMSIDSIGLSGKICDTVNDIISLNETLVEELTLARNTIGK